MTTLDPKEISSYSLSQDTEIGRSIQLTQTTHRIRLVSQFNIQPGDKVLEIGCGQGDCTAVLASVVGPEGHVTALDPGPLDYGQHHRVRNGRGIFNAILDRL